MPRPEGPHTRNSMPGTRYRGSKKRAARLDPFNELPASFWLFIVIAVTMTALSIAIMYSAAHGG